MAGENAANDGDEEVYGNDGAERHEAQEASAGDRRAIADADQAGQLDISGEAKTARTQRTPEPPTDATTHQRNGFVEAVHGHIQGLARCYQTQIETNTGIQLSAISPAIPFAIRYAGFVLSRFTVRPNGRTPFQHLLGTPYVSPLCMFGESVFALIPDHEVRAAKLTNRWISGCWWGRDASSDEHPVWTKHGLPEVQISSQKTSWRTMKPT